MENAQNAERGTEVLGRARNVEERRGTCLEEEVVHHPFVLQRESREGVWESEDDMGVPDRQQLTFTLGEPLIARVRQALWAVPIATRVERDGAMAAGGTAVEMSAQGGGPAALDRAKHTEVLRGEPGAMGLDEACPVLANDIGHLEGWPGHRLCSRRERGAASGPETSIVSSGFVTACR
jgi:hypothetical protein